MLNLLQKHTIDIYDLTHKKYVKEIVKARELLVNTRFDLFAKLYYARLHNIDPNSAINVYVNHIKAFNPDYKEPGRDDKISINNFIITFNGLLNTFKDNQFDDNISLIPVDEDRVILDGAHRVAALAYYDKFVTILRFKNVKSKGPFDYKYFQQRGLSWDICNIIANEMLLWKKNLLIACLWPKMGNSKNKEKAVSFLSDNFNICYEKEITVNLKSLSQFIKKLYVCQPWVQNPAAIMDKSINCYGNKNRTIRFVLLENNLPLDKILRIKEDLRNIFNMGKHSIHITDNYEETVDCARLVLSPEGLTEWLDISKKDEIINHFKEKWFYFKKIQLIKIKVEIYKIIKKIIILFL